jgi:N-acyl-D-amino-acid deacylase
LRWGEKIMRTLAVASLLLASSAISRPAGASPVVLTNGLIVDGSGSPPYVGWLAMDGDRITALGKGAAPAFAGDGVRQVLGQAIAPVQVVGALVVVATVIWLGLRRG